MTLRMICISDTHGFHESFSVPEGDILIHAGDVSMSGSVPQIEQFNAWFRKLPHRHKILIAGNHDWLFQRRPNRARQILDPSITYLEDSEATIEGRRIWGSPWSPWFNDWAFNLHRGEPIQEKWRLIPERIDVLVTHGPPLEAGDRVTGGGPEGCKDLRSEILDRIRPQLHIYGHIHEGYGRYEIEGIECINASLLDELYRPVNDPVIIDLN